MVGKDLYSGSWCLHYYRGVWVVVLLQCIIIVNFINSWLLISSKASSCEGTIFATHCNHALIAGIFFPWDAFLLWRHPSLLPQSPGTVPQSKAPPLRQVSTSRHHHHDHHHSSVNGWDTREHKNQARLAKSFLWCHVQGSDPCLTLASAIVSPSHT